METGNTLLASVVEQSFDIAHQKRERLYKDAREQCIKWLLDRSAREPEWLEVVWLLLCLQGKSAGRRYTALTVLEDAAETWSCLSDIGGIVNYDPYESDYQELPGRVHSFVVGLERALNKQGLWAIYEYGIKPVDTLCLESRALRLVEGSRQDAIRELRQITPIVGPGAEIYIGKPVLIDCVGDFVEVLNVLCDDDLWDGVKPIDPDLFAKLYEKLGGEVGKLTEGKLITSNQQEVDDD